MIGAVLVAIAIPIFTSQLEKSRDTTTVSNLRSAYAEAQTAYLSEDETNDHVAITKTNGALTSIAVDNVIAKGVQEGYTGNVDQDLPFTAPDAMGNGGSAEDGFTVTFAYDANGNVTGVTAAAN